jgi:hypothetical protein
LVVIGQICKKNAPPKVGGVLRSREGYYTSPPSCIRRGVKNEKIPPWMQDFLFNKTTNFYLKSN